VEAKRAGITVVSVEESELLEFIELPRKSYEEYSERDPEDEL
jgi:hypothetical protein